MRVCGPVTGECLTVIRGPVCDVAPCKRVVQADVLSSNASVSGDSDGCLMILKKRGVTYEMCDLKINVGFPMCVCVIRHIWTVWNSQRASSAFFSAMLAHFSA